MENTGEKIQVIEDRHPGNLYEAYLKYANMTHQYYLGPINEYQIKRLLYKAYDAGIFNQIDPTTIVKYGKNDDDVRFCQSTSLKIAWDNEMFIDPILKKYMIVITDDMFCNIELNTHRALKTTEIPSEMEPYMEYNNNPLYKDNRVTIGKKNNPPIFFNEDMLHLEVIRLAKKYAGLVLKIPKPSTYFKKPHLHEYHTIFKSKTRNSISILYEQYYQNCYAINLGNAGFRGVESRIEQYMWEQYVMRYYRRPETRPFLNELILDDNGIYCKIKVPPTHNEFGLIPFLNFPRDIQVVNGMLYYNDEPLPELTEYYKDDMKVIDQPEPLKSWRWNHWHKNQ